MVKNFETYINEDYFSKLSNRKDTGTVRKENEITEDFVRSFVDRNHLDSIKAIKIRKENGKTVVDIAGSFVLGDAMVEKIPFQFGIVTGDFDCSYTDITSLNGCPKDVGGDFKCAGCKHLTSLEGCPETVCGHFYCHNCGKKFTKEDIKSLYIKGHIFT